MIEISEIFNFRALQWLTVVIFSLLAEKEEFESLKGEICFVRQHLSVKQLMSYIDVPLKHHKLHD